MYIRHETELTWGGEETEWEEEVYTGQLNNLDFILGTPENLYGYALATCSVEMTPVYAQFWGGYVFGDSVRTMGEYFCLTDSSGFMDRGRSDELPVRPVVTISSEFLVEEQEDGTYQLAE